MKEKFLVILLLLSGHTISAQLVISSGAHLSMAGKVQLTLQNTDLINNGSFMAGHGITSFTGDASSSIGGSKSLQFNELEINKTNNASVILQDAIGVTRRLLFSSGFLNLDGFNTDLGTTGYLEGEQESTCVTGPNGGEILFNVNLDQPSNFNPANLGVFITSSKNLGHVTIKRGQQLQAGSGAETSIHRYYDILPMNNTNLDATVRFKYMDGELNGLNENSIVLFEKQNSTNWTGIGCNSKNTVVNFVEKTGVNSFGRFTLSNTNAVQNGHRVVSSLQAETNNFSLWPNPFHDKIFINIVAANQSQALIKIFDSKGAQVELKNAAISQGNNQVCIDMKVLANGIYHLSISWNNGQMQKTMRVLKQ